MKSGSDTRSPAISHYQAPAPRAERWAGRAGREEKGDSPRLHLISLFSQRGQELRKPPSKGFHTGSAQKPKDLTSSKASQMYCEDRWAARRRRRRVLNQHFPAKLLPGHTGAGQTSPQPGWLHHAAASSERSRETHLHPCSGGTSIPRPSDQPGSKLLHPCPLSWGVPGKPTGLAGLLHRGDLAARALRDDLHGVVGFLARPTRRQLLWDHRVGIWGGEGRGG